MGRGCGRPRPEPTACSFADPWHHPADGARAEPDAVAARPEARPRRRSRRPRRGGEPGRVARSGIRAGLGWGSGPGRVRTDRDGGPADRGPPPPQRRLRRPVQRCPVHRGEHPDDGKHRRPPRRPEPADAAADPGPRPPAQLAPRRPGRPDQLGAPRRLDPRLGPGAHRSRCRDLRPPKRTDPRGRPPRCCPGDAANEPPGGSPRLARSTRLDHDRLPSHRRPARRTWRRRHRRSGRRSVVPADEPDLGPVTRPGDDPLADDPRALLRPGLAPLADDAR